MTKLKVFGVIYGYLYCELCPLGGALLVRPLDSKFSTLISTGFGPMFAGTPCGG